MGLYSIESPSSSYQQMATEANGRRTVERRPANLHRGQRSSEAPAGYGDTASARLSVSNTQVLCICMSHAHMHTLKHTHT